MRYLRLLAPGWIITTAALAQGYPPEEAAARMTAAAGLSVRLVAAEPWVRQPVAIDFDDRGRLWVIQYLQYPNPAGLRRVAVDRYSRTTYDRLPEPPPRGPKGADRLTILEDSDGDGRADRARDFVTGLNLASGFAFGDGGVYVLNAPYLLFYPDRDRDDAPDGDPEVLLTGFGMDDAHSVANSLTFGPDGWLYGLQGSTVTARINGVEFQQGVWRFHPRSKRFELFAEGGGNMWGLDFDRQGNLFASTNVGGNVLLHFVQGGYYWKQFGKHGALHNPYAFGYFDHVKHEGIRGGHVAVGGLFYQAEAWPEPYRGAYLAADLLEHAAHWHELSPRGSTFQARQRGDLLIAHDSWFAPSDMTLGPDGSVYLADWHDRRTAHPDPDADWDRRNGRIFALDGPARTPTPQDFDMQALSTGDLVRMLSHPNGWYVRRARRILVERRDPSAVDALVAAAARGEGPAALEALWVLHGGGWLDDRLRNELLDRPDPALRAWVVRLLGDDPAPAGSAVGRLAALAAAEESARVRAQLAATAARLPREEGSAILRALIARDRDGDDPMVPLLLWWAVERHAAPGAPRPLSFDGAAWSSGIFRRTIAPRLARRYAADGTAAGDQACARLLDSAPDAAAERSLLEWLDEGLAARRAETVDPALRSRLLALAAADPNDAARLRPAVRLGDRRAAERALAPDDRAIGPESDRIGLIQAAGAAGDPAGVAPLLALAGASRSEPVRLAALGALARFDAPEIAPALLSAYTSQPPRWRERALEVLLGRPAAARRFLDAVASGSIDRSSVPLEPLRRLALFGDPAIDARVNALWGRLAGPTPEEKLAEVRRLNNDLRAAPGDAGAGRALFAKHCAACHRLRGEGQAIGPDLTGINRADRDALLVSLVDPGGIVRKEYAGSLLSLKDGRVLTGLLAENTPERVTIVDARAERTTIPRAAIESIADAPGSLMPEGLYRALAPQELRDLFAYLQAP